MAWNSSWMPNVHRHGRVDSIGYIHYSRLDEPVNARGLYRFLLLVAQAAVPQFRTGIAKPYPRWQWLYYVHTWAATVLLETFHRRAPVAWSANARQESWVLAHRTPGARWGESYRSWAVEGLQKVRKRTYLRRPVTIGEADAMVNLRSLGMTYREIAETMNRSQKVVWSHLRGKTK